MVIADFLKPVEPMILKIERIYNFFFSSVNVSTTYIYNNRMFSRAPSARQTQRVTHDQVEENVFTKSSVVQNVCLD